ncbi:MAG: hypothetical protein WCP79_14275 [Bacillota bacterium]
MYRLFLAKMITALAIVVTAVLVALAAESGLLGLGLVALGLGMRHGLDADHIVAIDNVTRKLLAEKKYSLTTGLYFALGHSTIVFILTVAVVFGAYQIKASGGALQEYGCIIGTLVSALFLGVTALLNVVSLRAALKDPGYAAAPVGLIAQFTKRLFNVSSSRGMYAIGFLFGLGFDTATEIALLSIAATAALHGGAVWLILALPVLFASGMVLIDTLDCVFMSSVFSWAAERQARLRKYNIAVTGFAAASALMLGAFGITGLLGTAYSWSGGLLRVSDWVNGNSEWLGLSIVCVFIGIWLYGHLRQRRSCPVSE